MEFCPADLEFDCVQEEIPGVFQEEVPRDVCLLAPKELPQRESVKGTSSRRQNVQRHCGA